MTSEGVGKRCPKCKKVDVTTFSKCRECGTRYDFKPEAKTREFNFLPIVAIGGFFMIAASAYAYLQVSDLYKKPTQLIGKTLTCKGHSLFVSTEKENLLSIGDDDFATLNQTANDGTPTSDAGALNHLAKMSGEFSVFEKYLNDPRFTDIQQDAKDPPFLVKVVGASAPTDKYSLVRVELLNGPRAGSVWWVDASKLILSLKDR